MSPAAPDTISFDVEGMTCASCALRIERVLGRQDGVESAVVNFAGQEARAVVDPGIVDIEGLQAAIEKLGYEIRPFAEGEDRRSLTERYDQEVAFQKRNVIGAAIPLGPEGGGEGEVAAAGLSYQAQCFTGFDRQTDIVNGFGHVPANIEIGSQVFYFQQVIVLHKTF